MKRPPSEHQVVDDEADHPGDDEDGACGEELAFGLASCWAVQEKVEDESAEPDRHESDGGEVYAERRADDEANDCPGKGRVDVSEYCHDELTVISVQLSVCYLHGKGYYLGAVDAISRVSLSVYQSVSLSDYRNHLSGDWDSHRRHKGHKMGRKVSCLSP